MNLLALLGLTTIIIFAVSGIMFATHRRRSKEPLLEDFVESKEE